MADLKISQLTSATTPLAGTEVVPLVQSSTTKKVTVANLTAGRTVDVNILLANSTSVDGNWKVQTNAAASALAGIGVNNNGGYGAYLIYDNSGRYVGGGAAIRNIANTPIYIETNNTIIGQFTTAGNYKPIAAKGLDYSANTPAAGMTSQLLNWYEEGTWTPAYSASGMSGITYGTFTGGTYVRVGDVVTAWFTVYTFGTFTKGTGAVTVTGLPFTSIGTTGYATGASLANCTRWDATPPVAARLDSSSTAIALFSNIGNTGGGADPTAVDAANMRSAAGENCNYFQGCIVYKV